jgi:hypothetical protein
MQDSVVNGEFEFEHLICDIGEQIRQVLIKKKKWRRNRELFDEIIKVCQNKTFRRGRLFFIWIVGLYGGQYYISHLIDLLDEEDRVIIAFTIEALRKLKAGEAKEKVRPFLNHKDADVRKEAKKYFAKIEGKSFVKKKRTSRRLPKGLKLEETSVNLDMEQLEPLLRNISSLIERGFAEDEIREVCELAEEMEVEQEKRLGFPIQFGREETALRIKIFMDDEESPDLYFFAPPKLIEKIEKIIDKI